MSGDVRTMLRAIQLMNQPKTFLWDTFVDQGDIEYSTAETAEVDIVRANGQRLAPLVASTVGGIVIDRDGFDTALIKFPTIAPERPITVSDIEKRSVGEGVFSGKTPEDRENELIAKDLTDLRISIANRKNHFVSQVLFKTPGKLSLDVMTEKGLKKGALKVDFQFKNGLTLLKSWDDPGSNPSDDIDAMVTSVIAGGGVPNIVILGTKAARAYRNNPNTKELYNIRNANYGVLSAAYVSPFLQFIGTNASGIEIYTYSATVLNDDGNMEPFVPVDGVFVGERSILKAVFGPVTQIDFGDEKHSTYVEFQEVPNRIVDQKTNMILNRLTSRPMIIPKNIDGWATATAIF